MNPRHADQITLTPSFVTYKTIGYTNRNASKERNTMTSKLNPKDTLTFLQFGDKLAKYYEILYRHAKKIRVTVTADEDFIIQKYFIEGETYDYLIAITCRKTGETKYYGGHYDKDDPDYMIYNDKLVHEVAIGAYLRLDPKSSRTFTRGKSLGGGQFALIDVENGSVISVDRMTRVCAYNKYLPKEHAYVYRVIPPKD